MSKNTPRHRRGVIEGGAYSGAPNPVISVEKRSRMDQGWVQRKRTGDGDQQAKSAAHGVAIQHEQKCSCLGQEKHSDTNQDRRQQPVTHVNRHSMHIYKACCAEFQSTKTQTDSA
jgi:hypothetical protein